MVHEEIKAEASQLEITLSELCARAKVRLSSFSRWKNGTPEPIRMYLRLREALEIEKERQLLGLNEQNEME